MSGSTKSIRLINALVNDSIDVSELDNRLSDIETRESFREAMQWRSSARRIAQSSTAMDIVSESEKAFGDMLASSAARSEIINNEYARTKLLSGAEFSRSVNKFGDDNEPYLETSDGTNIDFEQEWSVQFVVKMVTGLTSTNNDASPIRKGAGSSTSDDAEDSFNIIIQPHFDQPEFEIIVYLFGVDTSGNTIYTRLHYDNFGFYLLAGSRVTFVREGTDLSQMALYVNNTKHLPDEIVDNLSDFDHFQNGSDPINVGLHYGGTSSLDGWIEDIRIWSRALTQEEIATHYYRPLLPDEISDNDLKAYWTLSSANVDESVTDESGNGNDLNHGGDPPQKGLSILAPYVNALVTWFRPLFGINHTGADEPTIADFVDHNIIHLKSWGENGDDGDENTATLTFTVDLTDYTTLQLEWYIIDDSDSGGDNHNLRIDGTLEVSSITEGLESIDVSGYTGSSEIKISGYSTFNTTAGYDGLEIRLIRLLE